MLINKSMLAGALEVCRIDKEFPLLNTILIDTDGTVCAMNKMLLYAAEPVKKDVSDKVPLPAKGALEKRIVLSHDTALMLLKMIPQDKLFGGLLEHVSLQFVEGSSNEVMAVVKDGQHTQSVALRTVKIEWGDWKAVFKTVYNTRKSIDTFVYNRKRLEAAVAAIRTSCQYQGDFSPVFSWYSSEGRMLWKCVNQLTAQSVLIVSNLAEIQELTHEESVWEKSLYKSKLTITIKNK